METVETKTINLTDEAAQAVLGIFKDKELDSTTHYLRVYIAGQGCSGYQYGLGLEADKRENDLVFEHNSVKVLVDDVSIQYMNGSTYMKTPYLFKTVKECLFKSRLRINRLRMMRLLIHPQWLEVTF